MSRKKILVLGATGGTGQQIVAQAHEAGHEVTAFARTPDKISIRHETLRLAVGSVTDDGPALAEAMRGQDVVISAIGRGTSFKSTHLIQRSVPVILAAMQAQGVRRLLFTSALGVGDTRRGAPLFLRI